MKAAIIMAWVSIVALGVSYVVYRLAPHLQTINTALEVVK